MGCLVCYKTKIQCLKMLKLQLDLLPPNGRTAHRLANVQAVVIGVLERCGRGDEIDPRYIQLVDNAYERAQSFITDQIISVETWYKEDEGISN